MSSKEENHQTRTLFCALSGNRTWDTLFKGRWMTCSVELTKVQFSCCQDFCLRFIVREANYNNIIMSKNFESVPQKLMVEIIRRRQVPQVIRRITFKFRFFRKDEFSFERLRLITFQLRWTKTVKEANHREKQRIAPGAERMKTRANRQVMIGLVSFSDWLKMSRQR